jgi:hypothetical protein
MRRLRSAAAATAVAICVTLLSAGSAQAKPPSATIVDNGNGTVTVTYVDDPIATNPGVYFCARSVAPADCRVGGPTENIIYVASARLGMAVSPVTFAGGSPVFSMGSGDPAGLTPGVYTMTYWVTLGSTVLASAEDVVITGHDSPPPPPPWVQSYGRPSAEAGCDDGWSPSWEQWPHGGQGGYVCTREIPSLGS